jgi:uncharacterized protein YciI
MPQFLVLADDYSDDEALNRRMLSREAHLRRMSIEKTEGRFIIGGAKLDEQNKMCGSMLVVELQSRQSVEQWLSADPYVTSKVWEHIEIIPFRVAPV